MVASNTLVHDPDCPRIKNPLFPTGKETGLHWDWVIVDEAHHSAANPKTRLGGALRSKASKMTVGSFVLLLTATPMQNKVEEFCNIVELAYGKTGKFDGIFKKHGKEIRQGQQKNASSFPKEASEEPRRKTPRYGM